MENQCKITRIQGDVFHSGRWSIFITYIITHHGLEGFSGLINGLIAAAIGALSMLMSKPSAKKLCKEDMYVCPLNRDIYIYIYIYDALN